MPSTGTPSSQTVRGARGASLFVDGGRPSGKDDAARRELADEPVGDVVGMELAVDVLLADPARDQLRVLRAEVEDQDAVVAHSIR